MVDFACWLSYVGKVLRAACKAGLLLSIIFFKRKFLYFLCIVKTTYITYTSEFVFVCLCICVVYMYAHFLTNVHFL